MPNNEVVTGVERAWTLKEKLGEGDAGEVYRVESLIEQKSAILKRPSRSAFSSDTIRQANQIARESQILQSLTQKHTQGAKVSTPILLDKSQPGSEFSDRFFIIITEAKGINLAALARAVRFGAINEEEILNLAPAGLTPYERTYLETLVHAGQLSDLVLLRILDSLLNFLFKIQSYQDQPKGSGQAIIWNDIKSEHIFYQPQTAHLTLIDWGNAHYLDEKGTTSDLQHSRTDDFRQFLDEMGRILSDFSPDLFTTLIWPSEQPSNLLLTEIIPALQQRISDQLKIALKNLEASHRDERRILESHKYHLEDYNQLKEIQQKLQILGEIPDYTATRKFALKIAQELIHSGEIEKFHELCKWLSEDASQDNRMWLVLAQLSDLLSNEPALRGCLHYALQEDWTQVLWELRQAARFEPFPAWWESLNTIIRELELNGTQPTLTPRTAINRLLLSLQASVQANHTSETGRMNPSLVNSDQADVTRDELTSRRVKLIHDLKEEANLRWSALEPEPPDSDIGYQEILRFSQEILSLAPNAGQSLMRALEQPLAQVRIVWDAWERKEFEIARRGLRRVLIWDPDRRRLLTADQAIQSASGWLDRLSKGPGNNEALQDFITRYELEGRELRNKVGPTSWLDTITSALRDLRRGGEPTDTLIKYPSTRPYLGWLLELQVDHPFLSIPGKVITLDRKPKSDYPEPGLRGAHQANFGENQEVQLGDPLDTWAAEAIGSSARVFQASITGSGRERIQVAIKLMRPNRMDYALPLFKEEIQILSLMRDVPGVAPLLEFGFFNLSSGQSWPLDDQRTSARNLTGTVIRYGLDSTHNYLADLENKAQQGFLPYLAIQLQEQSKNLLSLCDTGYTRGRFLPVLEGILLSIQICDILEEAHIRNIAYRDHKILHYYWDEETNGVTMIDWNIAKRYPQGLSPEEARFDLVQFGARAMHHILTGRTAPGALPLGPTRPEEIEAAAKTYAVQWTYDDQRLPKSVKDIIEKVMTGGYEKPRQLRDDLIHSFHSLSELTQQKPENDLHEDSNKAD